MYVYPMTIRRKKKREPNAMEIGSAEVKGRFESDSKFGELEEEDNDQKDTRPWGGF